LILRDRDATGHGTLGERLYALQDPNWNVVAIADAGGAVVERYLYSAYGERGCLTPLFVSTGDAGLYSWDFAFTSRPLDLATGVYDYRARPYGPALGRFFGRDASGYTAGDWNLYGYVGNGPANATDPMGHVRRTLGSHPSGTPIAAYSITWTGIRLDHPQRCVVVLIQHLHVVGHNNVTGDLGPVDYYENLGTIAQGAVLLVHGDLWAYQGDRQYPPAQPQITAEDVTETGTITAYEYTGALRNALSTWGTWPGYPFGNGRWTSGTYPANTTFDAAGARVMETEGVQHSATSTWSRTARNHLTVQ
jgi:RHS repeat-associated protein